MDTGPVPTSYPGKATASFGYWVRRRRLALDLTQAALAHEVGCARITVSKIERDERRPSRQMAELLADHLSIPEEERDRFLAVALGERAVDIMLLPDQPVDPAATPGEHGPTRVLPTPSTPFVGRETELAQLLTRLEDPVCRLLTLVGPGGFGKTRLSIRLGELASERPDLGTDGVFFVALDGLDSSEGVVPAIAAALSFSFHEQGEQEKQLLSYLKGKRYLLIFDNAEGILDPELVLRLLDAADAVKMLVSTREALNVREEWFHPISGMSVDSDDSVRQADDAGHKYDAVHYSDAVEFFNRCAVRVRPDFDLAQEASHVRTICRIVGGVPLAIELAAAWLKVLTSEQVRRELIQGIDILTSSMRDVPDRHRSMRAVLEQSWRYLSDEEQRVFRQLSVFSGGFRRSAALAVTGASLPVLASLVDKSVLQLGHDGRYRIHALLRQMGADRLAADPAEVAEVSERHSTYYLDFLRDRAESIAGPDQRQVLLEVQAEMDNIRRAWAYAARRRDVDYLEQALPSLFRFLWIRGRYREGEALLAEALDSMNRERLSENECRFRSTLTARHALFVAATSDTVRAAAIVGGIHLRQDSIQVSPEQALVLYVKAMIAMYEYVPEAYSALSAAYEMYQKLGDEPAIAETALRLHFIVTWMHGDFSEGQRLVEESLGIYRKLGDVSGIADALRTRASLLWALGEYDSTEVSAQESLRLARGIGNRLIEQAAIGDLAHVAYCRGEHKRAISLARERLALAEQLGQATEIDKAYSLLGMIFSHSFEFEEAVRVIVIHPGVRPWAWSEQALIAVGRYANAMETLPAQTSIIAEGGWRYYSVDNLTSWAMLLTSECPLLRNGSPPSKPSRIGLAREILTLVSSYDPNRSRAVSRAFAAKLLAGLEEPTQPQESALKTVPNTSRSVQEIARELLTIRLA